jgi:hypothetical protein
MADEWVSRPGRRMTRREMIHSFIVVYRLPSRSYTRVSYLLWEDHEFASHTRCGKRNCARAVIQFQLDRMV